MMTVVPVGLMALQGDDESGKIVRAAMKELGVSADLVQGWRTVI